MTPAGPTAVDSALDAQTRGIPPDVRRYLEGRKREPIKILRGNQAAEEGDMSDSKQYWETRLPQTWYSDKAVGSLEWFNELAYQRYQVYYSYLPAVAEFEHHRGERVLEIGVGVGTDLVQYARNGARVSGIDLAEAAVESTRRQFHAYGLAADHLDTGDAQSLCFDDNSFDLVYSFGVLHHVSDVDKAIREIYRVLKPEGKCIVMLYARGWKHYLKRLFLHGLVKGKLFRYGHQETINKTTEVHGDSPFTRVYTKRQAGRLFGDFARATIRRYRLGEFFDYAPYRTSKLPAPITRLCYGLGLEQWLGENYIIKAYKSNKRHHQATVAEVLWNSYNLSTLR